MVISRDQIANSINLVSKQVDRRLKTSKQIDFFNRSTQDWITDSKLRRELKKESINSFRKSSSPHEQSHMSKTHRRNKPDGNINLKKRIRKVFESNQILTPYVLPKNIGHSD